MCKPSSIFLRHLHGYSSFILLILLSVMFVNEVGAVDKVSIQYEIPELAVQPYHRPYVAIWIENNDRDGIETLDVQHEKKKWLKDMRQWWRRIGRSETPPYDAVSSATKKPGKYKLEWISDKVVDPKITEYWLVIEAAREEGGRELLRQKVLLGTSEAQSYILNGKSELGEISIEISPIQD